MSTRTSPRLPVAPLAVELERAARHQGVTLQVLLDNSARLHAFRAARRAGVIELELAEDLCEQVLGWHLRMIYGDAWDRAVGQAAGHTLPNYREGTRSAYNHGCRCVACCRANAAYTAQRRRSTQPGGGEAA